MREGSRILLQLLPQPDSLLPLIRAYLGVNTTPETSSRYQNLGRNPYGLLPRPPQTQAAPLKPLYQKASSENLWVTDTLQWAPEARHHGLPQ
jgi:hypothetical protein